MGLKHRINSGMHLFILNIHETSQKEVFLLYAQKQRYQRYQCFILLVGFCKVTGTFYLFLAGKVRIKVFHKYK